MIGITSLIRYNLPLNWLNSQQSCLYMQWELPAEILGYERLHKTNEKQVKKISKSKEAEEINIESNTNSKDKLTEKEIEAVATFVSKEGKNWKNKLSSFVQ